MLYLVKYEKGICLVILELSITDDCSFCQERCGIYLHSGYEGLSVDSEAKDTEHFIASHPKLYEKKALWILTDNYAGENPKNSNPKLRKKKGCSPRRF